MNDTVRFIIITVVPQSVASEIDRARRSVCAVGGSAAALAYPPHVTLRTGVRVPVDMVSAFLDEFGTVVGQWDPFPLQTDGVWLTSYAEAGVGKRLVGYRVKKHPLLMALNERLQRHTRWRASDRVSFDPHLTMAFDDLSEEGFLAIRSWLERTPGAIPTGFEWTCDNVGVFRREGDTWSAYKLWRQ